MIFWRLVSIYWICCRQMRCIHFVHWNNTFSILLKYYDPQNELRWTIEQPTLLPVEQTTSWLRYYWPTVVHRLQVSQLHVCKYNSENNKLQRNNGVTVETDSANYKVKILRVMLRPFHVLQLVNIWVCMITVYPLQLSCMRH